MSSSARAPELVPMEANLVTEAVPFELRRIGVVMEPEPGNLHEVEGVLNPAVVRGPDGQLYLFPRLVARGNYSRIGIARVLFNADGDPNGVERLGIALEPAAPYELHAGGGGCEDPRISFVEPLGQYVMTYTAFSPDGPRIALAVSKDLFRWERLGLVTFTPEDGLDFNWVNNKDALIFPVAVPDPSGRPAMAMIHRPLFFGTDAHETATGPTPRAIDPARESIWIAYCPLDQVGDHLERLCHFRSNHRLAAPVAAWERLKVGAGAPPLITPLGWLVVYHGVSLALDGSGPSDGLRYSAGALVLDAHDARVIRYRSPSPILTPEAPGERKGAVTDVVFPTGADRRTDIGQPNRIDVYYGMADSRIGAARLDVPVAFPPGTPADPRGGRV